jgi:hypothetical protein
VFPSSRPIKLENRTKGETQDLSSTLKVGSKVPVIADNGQHLYLSNMKAILGIRGEPISFCELDENLLIFAAGELSSSVSSATCSWLCSHSVQMQQNTLNCESRTSLQRSKTS